jgi:hypothetical protein
MLQGSLFGRAEGKRTINVQANLLSERLQERKAVVISAQRKLIFVAVSVALGSVAVPWLLSVRGDWARKAQVAGAKTSGLSAELDKLRSSREQAVPQINESDMASMLQRRTHAFLGQVSYVLNGVSPSMACSSVRAEVAGGEASIVFRADAADVDAVRQFVSKTAGGPGSKSAALTATRKSDVLGPTGVSFDFVKRAQVGP